MLTSMDMYWLTRLDSLNTWLWIVVIISGLASMVAVLAAMIATATRDRCAVYLRRIAKYVVTVFFVFGTGSVLVPTTKEMVAIYVVPAIANNEQVRSIPDTALKLADEYLKQKLDELIGEKHKK